MRVLFTAPRGLGHFHPLVPLAQAARDAGHVVAFATPAKNAPPVERLGLPFLRGGPDRAVLADPAYKQAAARVQAEMEALPPLEHAVRLLERFGSTGAPQVRPQEAVR